MARFRVSKSTIKRNIEAAQKSRDQHLESLRQLIGTESDEYLDIVERASVAYECALEAKKEKAEFEKLIAGYGKDEYGDCPKVYKSNRDYYSRKQTEYYDKYQSYKSEALKMNENAVNDIKKVWYYTFKTTEHWAVVL